MEKAELTQEGHKSGKLWKTEKHPCSARMFLFYGRSAIGTHLLFTGVLLKELQQKLFSFYGNQREYR